ncbi:MAG: hypothetical protein VB031_09535 [Eubacteriaceae bacterium]|nr:hypothetical protein [Eubacteriaceae bacterium]
MDRAKDYAYKFFIRPDMELHSPRREEPYVVETKNEVFMVRDKNGVELQHKYWDIGLGKIFQFSEDDETSDIEENKSKAYQIYKENFVLEKIEEEFKLYAESIRNMPYPGRENLIEEQHFNEIETLVREECESAEKEVEGMELMSNGNSPDFDPDCYKEKNEKIENRNQKKAIMDKPYFGEVITKDDRIVYLGNSEIKGKVLDWRDSTMGHIFYNPESNNNVNVIRDFIITKGTYEAFSDRVNNENKELVEADGFLVKLIESQRSDVNVKSIANTIQALQYSVIKEPIGTDMAVIGCAGSGKTAIMLRRLSYMVFNKYIVPEDITVISPNQLLNMENVELAKKLDLGDCKRMDMHDFYIEAIKNHIIDSNLLKYRDNGFIDRLRQKQLWSNYFVDSGIIKTIYSTDFKLQFQETVLNIMYHPENEYDGLAFREYEGKRISARAEEIFGYSVDREEDGAVIEYYSKMIREYLDVCRSISKNNIEAKLLGKNSDSNTLKDEIEKMEATLQTAVQKAERIKEGYRAKKEKIEDVLDNTEFELYEILSKLNAIKNESTLFGSEKRGILTLSKRELEKEIKELNADLDRIEKEKAAALNKEVPGLKEYERNKMKYDSLKLFFEESDMSGEEVKTTADKYSLNESLYKPIYSFYEKYMVQLNEAAAKRNVTVHTFLHELKELYIRIESFKQCSSDHTDGYAIDTIDAVIDYYKEKIGLEKRDYEFELYLVLTALSGIYNISNKRKGLLILDEFQDCSLNEIKLITRAYDPESVNLYGDPMQCIISKGISNNDIRYYEDHGYEKSVKFDTNYRNAEEITEYINERLHLDIKGIGLHGKAEEIKNCDFAGLYKRAGDKRTALIVKSREEYESLANDENRYNFVDESNMVLSKEKDNVIPVRLVKGMEFENVYVYDLNMNEREMYVACTRALENLCVVCADK